MEIDYLKLVTFIHTFQQTQFTIKIPSKNYTEIEKPFTEDSEIVKTSFQLPSFQEINDHPVLNITIFFLMSGRSMTLHMVFGAVHGIAVMNLISRFILNFILSV